MKKNYKFLTGLALVLANQLISAQLTVMTVGEYIPGGVSDNGIVSFFNTSSGDTYKWDSTGGFVQIGSGIGSAISGYARITRDGSKIASTVTNPDTNVPEVAVYDLATGTWTFLGSIAPLQSGWNLLSYATDFSKDGTAIVGAGQISEFDWHALKWDAVNGMQDLGSIVSGLSSRGNGISTDKTVVVGYQLEGSSFRGAKWVNGVESFILDNNNIKVGEAWAVAEDGKTIVGTSNPNAYVWKEGSGVTYITHPNAGSSFRGASMAVSEDGSIVLGYYRPFPGSVVGGEGFIWTPSGGRVNLNDYVTGLGIDTQGIKLSFPVAISSDKMKIVGLGVKTATFQTVGFYLDLTSATLASQNIKTPNNISVFPNPVKDILTITGGKIQSAEIYSITGQKIKSLKLDNNKADVSSLPKGTYLLQTNSGAEKQSIKFIKE